MKPKISCYLIMADQQRNTRYKPIRPDVRRPALTYGKMKDFVRITPYEAPAN